MDFSQKQNTQVISALLFLTVITQALYTVLFVSGSELPRQWIWGLEGVVFVFIAAIAGSALFQAKKYFLGFSAIFASGILNVVQVGVGLTQFGPFSAAAQGVEAIGPVAGAVVAFSFFVYNAAKILLGIAAVVFGTAISRAGSQAGSKWLGKLTALAGVAAIVTNAIVMMFGRIEAVPSGATGVVATLLLAVCLLKLRSVE